MTLHAHTQTFFFSPKHAQLPQMTDKKAQTARVSRETLGHRCPNSARGIKSDAVFTPITPAAPNRALVARLQAPDVGRGQSPRLRRLTTSDNVHTIQAHRSTLSPMQQDRTSATPRPSTAFTPRKGESKPEAKGPADVSDIDEGRALEKITPLPKLPAGDSASGTQQGEGAPSHGGRPRPSTASTAPRNACESKSEAKGPEDLKNEVRHHIRILAGSGNHIEREHAVHELYECLQCQLLSRSWIVDQGNLVENLVNLALMGTPGQKDATAVLLCLLADSSSKVKKSIVRVPKNIPALLRLLRGSTDVQRVNAAATVWFLAEDEEFRTSISAHGEMFELLADCIDKGTSPQSEHASGALQMLTFGNERNALSTLQIDRLPEILLNAAKSGSPGESLQAVSLIAQLSSFESVSLKFLTHFAALDDSLECLLRILARDPMDRSGIGIKVQAAICLRNLLTVPEVCDLAHGIKGLVPTCIECFIASEGILRLRVLSTLKTMAGDEKMKTAIGQQESIYPVLVSMMGNFRNTLEVHHSLSFMKVISQDAGVSVACQAVISDMLAILLGLSSSVRKLDTLTGTCSLSTVNPSSPDALKHEYIHCMQDASTLPKNAEDETRIKAVAVIRNLASNPHFCQSMCDTPRLLQILDQLLSKCPNAGYRQALGALCNLAAFGTAAALIMSFPPFDEEHVGKTLAEKENTILNNLICLTKSRDEWTCTQSIITLQNLIEHDVDVSKYEEEMIGKFESVVMSGKDVAMQAKVKAATALASLTCHDSACRLIAELPDNRDTRIFGFLIGLGRQDALTDEIVVGLWALCNIAALNVNNEKKFLEIEFLLDRIAHSAVNGSDEEKVAAAAVIKNLCAHSVLSAEYIGNKNGVLETLHQLALSEDPAVYEHALGALCNLTTECVKNRLKSVGDKQLSFSVQLAAKARTCLNDANDIIKVYAAGLICNMAASDEGKDAASEIGRHHNLLEYLVACLLSPSEGVRINALSALCNLAHTDMNKIHIGQVPGCLETLNSFLHTGTDAEKAQTSMLIFYLSFSFKINAAFGKLHGALDRVVQLFKMGNDEQIENAAAALSILACNNNNADILTREQERASLLQALSSTLKNGNDRQRVNTVVCMWNLSVSSAAIKSEIGKLPSIFLLLVECLREDYTCELANQTVGLLSELLHENQRNCTLYGKVEQGLEMMLEIAFQHLVKPIVELNACWGIANFAVGDDERLRRVVEIEGGLAAISRLVANGDKKQQEYACKLLASSVLKSQAGRKKILRVHGLLVSLIDVCKTTVDQRREYSVEVLNNLAAGPSTRQALAKVESIVKALEVVIADSQSSKRAQFYATSCLASLCLDPDLADTLGDWENTHGLLLFNLKCDDPDLVDAAAEAFHNLLASNEENREMFSMKEDLMDRIVELAGVGDGRTSGMHAVGGLFQLVRASPEFARRISQHHSLANQLIKALQCGSDKAKELSCAILAILGENDDDTSSLHDDVLNMQIAMCDGSYDALQNLFTRGTPQQAMHATAVLSNLLISAGSFMKMQLAENEDFLKALVKFTENASPLHRTYAVRLLFHMLKGDEHIIQLVAKMPSSIPILLELLETGTADQRSYSCLCFVQLASVPCIAKNIATYNKGHIFKMVLYVLRDAWSPMKGAALEILRLLTADDTGKEEVIRIEGLVDFLAQVACKGRKEHSTSSSGILLELSKSSKEVRETLAKTEETQNTIANLLQLQGMGRQNAAMLIFFLASEKENLECLVKIPGVFDTLGQMIVQGDYLDHDSGCSALWKLLQHPEKGLKHLSKSSQVLSRFVSIMEEKNESGYATATNERVQIVLSAILEMGKDEYGCSVISLVPGIFRVLIYEAGREGAGDGQPGRALSVLKKLMQENSTCWDMMLQEPNAIAVVLGAIRVGNASLVCDALVILEMLSEKVRGFQPLIMEANKDKGDVWDTLLSFTDEKLMNDAVFTTAEYNSQRDRAFRILTMLAKGNQLACDRIAQKRVCTNLIANCILHVGGPCKQSALKLSIECSALNAHFAKKLGNEPNLIKTLTGALGADTKVQFDYPFCLYEQKLSLSLLTCLSSNEILCKSIGTTPAFGVAILGIIKDGLESRLKEQANLDQNHTGSAPDKDVGGPPQGDETDAIGKVTSEDEKKSLDYFEKTIANGLSTPDLAESLDDKYHLDIEAANLLCTLIRNNTICNAFVRVPFPLVETLVMQGLAQQEQQRKNALSTIWTFATTSNYGLELLGKKAAPLLQALFRICLRRKQHLEEVLLLLADLVQEKKYKMALLANTNFMQLLVDMTSDSKLAVNSIRVIECLARDFNEGKHVLGERQDLMKTLVKLKYTGAELLAKAASIAMDHLSKDCDVNAGTFRRLRVDYA